MTKQYEQILNQWWSWGWIAFTYGELLPLKVLHSNAGYYIGTVKGEETFTRESEEYWGVRSDAQNALDYRIWTPRSKP